MKANCITISVPGSCREKCPYCVSNMTYGVKENPYLFGANLEKAAALARRIGVTHCLITGKGEPFDNLQAVKDVALAFPDFYTEIQTHLKDFSMDQLETINTYNIDVLAISIDHPSQFDNVGVWQTMTAMNQVIRIAIVLTKEFDGYGLMWYIDKCNELGIRQLTIRQPTVPKNLADTDIAFQTADWIRINTNTAMYDDLIDELDQMAQDDKITHIRNLEFGTDVWDINGVSFVAMKYCVESENGQVLRNLIYQADGHLYTTWDSRGSILW